MPNIALLNPTTKGLESLFVKLRSSVITWGSLVSSNTNLSDKQDHQPAVTFKTTNWSQIGKDSTSSIQEQTESNEQRRQEKIGKEESPRPKSAINKEASHHRIKSYGQS